ncbi:glycosyl hydrolase family 18 protein [Pedobacter sp. KR3-3]|uniref:chitinase n=1 Tax=Pedobacter albus TaxID=3113905 RepID=A0ABU7IAG6_9SPHI|nr:glycosyl hydrolase family 18 protein [Pedobacter sp. KR3-3]MEE1946468.1 glycosyl hydrolase family 18 protein [Pedobacter sp. KR3-3]
MKLKNLLLICSLGLFAFGACKKSDSQPAESDNNTPPAVTPTPYIPDNSFKIVAYMPSYKDPETVDISKYKMITHLFYAFLEIDAAADGTLKALSQPSRFATVMQRARANNVKVGISVSGSSAYFATMASSATARTKFVTNVVNFAKNNDLNGVDIDWEYPSTSGSAPSADNFTLLMKELSTELHKINKFLSAAVTPAVYSGGIREGIKPEVFQYVDFFNIMQYDGPGYDQAEPYQHASYKMSVASLDQWLGVKGLPKEKAIVGLPLYGENSTGSAKSYRDIEAAGVDVTGNSGMVAGVEYWFNGINLIKQKTQLAKDRANGIMFWEFSFDSNTTKSLIRAANDQLGRTY